MGWLEDRMIKYIYKNTEGDEIILELHVSEDPPDEYEGYARSGFVPEELGGYVRIQFERNGRVAYEYRSSGKKPRTVSATRENYEHNVGNMGSKALKESGSKKAESVYTKSFGKAVEEAKMKKSKEFSEGLKKITKGAK